MKWEEFSIEQKENKRSYRSFNRYRDAVAFWLHFD